MTPDEERLADLLRRAASDPRPVEFAAVERGARRRQARNVTAAAVAATVLLGAGVAAAAQLGSSGSKAEPLLVGPTRPGSCPAFEPYQIDQAQMQHTSSEADRVVTAAFPNDSLVETFPVLVADPLAPIVGLGSATTPRKMWVAVRREVATTRPPGSLGPPGLTPGTVSIIAALVDDKTLQLGGNLGCGVGASPPAVSQSPSAPSSSFPGKCCVPPAEPSMRISVQPESGPVGTAVRLLITGCGVADPANEATVSFNNDALNMSARFNPNTVRDLGIHRGARITLSYKIAPGDRTGGLGQFFVQCGQTVLDTPFRVTS